jgi:hypothetical protein
MVVARLEVNFCNYLWQIHQFVSRAHSCIERIPFRVHHVMTLHHTYNALRSMKYEHERHDSLYKDLNPGDVSSFCWISRVRMSGWQFFPGKRFRQSNQIVYVTFTELVTECESSGIPASINRSRSVPKRRCDRPLSCRLSLFMLPVTGPIP